MKNKKIILVVVILLLIIIAVTLYFVFNNKDNKFSIFSSDCDDANKGYNKNGRLDPRCGATAGACDPNKCSESEIGYDTCGYFSEKCAGGGKDLCNPSRPGYDYNNKYNPICDKGDEMLNCDCSRPGYNLYGTRKSDCDEFMGIQYQKDCK